MSDNQNCGIDEQSKYEAMTTEELEEILRLDADAPNGQESDTETLFYIMEVLAKRKKNTSHSENTAQKAYESFKKNYLPEVEKNMFAPEKKTARQRKPLRWLRGMSAAAAVLVIVLLGSVTAKAFGYDIWGAVIQWTQETFQFGDNEKSDEPRSDGTLQFASLQDALESAGVNAAVAPKWFPSGYELKTIAVNETPQQDVYTAKYSNGENELIVTLRHHLRSDPQYIEQSDKLVETYKVSGITYYILVNNEQNQVAWIDGSFECYIIGDISVDELKLMVDSIKKG